MMTMTEENTQAPLTDDELDAQLPRPVGYKLLIALPKVEETYESGLLKADRTIQQEHILSMVGLVLDMGEQAYKDPDRYPTGPWCEVGNYVLFRSNSGTRFRVNGVEYRFLNDDSIDGVVADPRGITRA
jgi:co-chaperonin GroES (HSP10)